MPLVSTVRARRWLAVAASLFAFTVFGTGRARAFGDLFRFNDAAAVGGGGGHWFTGSHAYGFGCEVCHDGPASTQISVEGLPPSYVPGATYQLLVRWPISSLHVTGLVEMTDDAGRGVGTVSVSDAPPPTERCVPVDDGVPAALVFAGPELNLENNRQLVGMQDCGGQQLHWSWTAPRTDVGRVWFSGGLVEPNHDLTANGDRTAKFLRPIASPSDAASSIRTGAASNVGGQCSVRAAVGGGGDPRSWSVVVALAIAFTLARRRKLAIAAVLLAIAALGCNGDPVQYGAVPSPDGATFARDVYPVLLRDCAFSTCHGLPERFLRIVGPGRMRLDPLSKPEDPATLPELALSYERTRDMLSTAAALEDSLLLRKPLEVEAGGQEHVGTDDFGRNQFTSQADPRYLMLAAWARTVGLPPTLADLPAPPSAANP